MTLLYAFRHPIRWWQFRKCGRIQVTYERPLSGSRVTADDVRREWDASVPGVPEYVRFPEGCGEVYRRVPCPPFEPERKVYEAHKPERHSSQEIDELFASEEDEEKAQTGCAYLFFFVLALAVAAVVALSNA